MSFTRKILDGVNEFLESVVAGDSPLSGIDEAELQRERERRAAFRKDATPRSADENPVAKLAGAGEDARDRRRELQEKRVLKTSRESEAREAARKKAQDEEFARVSAEARRQRPPSSAWADMPPRGDAGGEPRRPSSGGMPGFGKKPDIAKHYEVLNLPYGAPFDQVKSSYRKLMRKYHPDLHNQTPKKQKAATELTMQVTQAYNALENYLEGGPNKNRK